MDAEGGERDPLIDHSDDRDDDDEGNETTGFDPGYPGASSTPATRQTTMNRPHAQTLYCELLPDTPGLSTTTFAEQELIKEFPDFKRIQIKAKMVKGRLEVGLIDPKKPYKPLITEIKGKGEYQINKGLAKEVLRALGKSRRVTLENEIKNLTEGIKDNVALK